MQKNLAIVFLFVVLCFPNDYALGQKRKAAAPKSKTSANSASKPNRNDFEQNFLGETESNTYKNRFFDVKLATPEGWLIQETPFNAALKKVGAQVIKGKTSQTQKAFDEANQRLTVLFTATKDILGIEGNAVMVLSAEKSTPFFQIRNGQDYLRLNLQSFKKLQLPPDFKYSETIESEKLGNENFYFLDIERAGYRQRLYATARKGYALFFTLSYSTPGDLAAMRAAIGNSDFSWKE